MCWTRKVALGIGCGTCRKRYEYASAEDAGVSHRRSRHLLGREIRCDFRSLHGGDSAFGRKIHSEGVRGPSELDARSAVTPLGPAGGGFVYRTGAPVISGRRFAVTPLHTSWRGFRLWRALGVTALSHFLEVLPLARTLGRGADFAMKAARAGAALTAAEKTPRTCVS